VQERLSNRCRAAQPIGTHLLIGALSRRYEYPSLKATAIALAKKHRPNYVLIEDASTGTALAQEFRDVYFDGAVRLVPIERDKIGRLYVNQAKFEAGLVVFPKGAPLLAAPCRGKMAPTIMRENTKI
jgi:phage terminase large subunit-like protein